MIEEEKKAIKKLNNRKNIDLISLLRKLKKEGAENFVITRKEIIDTLLNLIQEKQAEIDEMAEELSNQYRNHEPCDLDGEMNCKKYKTCKECVKQYFEKKVEGKQ